MIHRFGDYELDTQLYQLYRAGELVELEPKVFDLLIYLIQHHERVISKDELLDKLWPGQVVSETALTQCVMAARKAVDDNGTRQHTIKTQHGRGYRFVASVTTIAPPVASSQHAVASRQQEESQKANGKNQKAKVDETEAEIETEKSSLDEAQRNPGEEESFSRIPLRSIRATELSDPRRQTLDVSMPARSWSSTRLALVAVLLLTGITLTVHYLSRPTLSTQDSGLRTNAAPAALPLPDKPSIIVLPFVNLSGDPGQEYFSDGMTEEITSALSRISSLFVIARTSAFTYKGKAAKVQDISREMGVHYVLEGSARKADAQVRIIAQLIDATTGEHLWSERYDRPLTDIFTLQDEIVQKMVTTLGLQLTMQEQGYIVRKRTDNLEAYDAVLRGRESQSRFTQEANTQAQQMFEKALALDPQYAEVYTFLGLIYRLAWVLRWSADPQTLERALALAQQALALDDALPRAHSLLGFVYAAKQQYDQAIAEGERAIALDPNNADSYTYQAEVLNFAGRPEEALRLVEQAIRLNPRSPPFYLLNLGWAYNLTGRYAEAITVLREAISRNPNFLSTHFHLAVSYAQQWAFQQSADARTLSQAVAAAQRVLALNDAFPPGHVILGYIYLWQKQYEPALAEMERGIALDPNDAVSYTVLAETLSRVGRVEEAVGMVEQALRRKPIPVDQHLIFIGTAYYLAGRPAEAIAPLKQSLSRYPNILGARLTLAAVYSELGKDAEARAEVAEVLRLNPQFSLEVYKERAPIKDPATLERHIAALRRAGLK